MIGHNSLGILQEYSKAIDEYRRDAVRKLEGMRLNTRKSGMNLLNQFVQRHNFRVARDPGTIAAVTRRT